MKTIREIYRIGHGPSSSHTMAPRFAAEKFLEDFKGAPYFEVTLYGSLAATGKGHFTDKAIMEVLQPYGKVDTIWKPEIILPYHPNGMKFKAFDADRKLISEKTYYSVGGGALEEEGKPNVLPDIYPLTKMTDILQWCERSGKTYWEYVIENEPADFDLLGYLGRVLSTMYETVERGLQKEGRLPGPLNLPRKAAQYYIKASGYQGSMRNRGLVFAYALAVSEENASGGLVVTAPTCGSCGVLPAVLCHLGTNYQFSEMKIVRALATAALFGNVVKENASISGAEVGCQGEVGVACAMAAAAACQLFGGSPAQIEYAAEMALEHHLGMTCDPICGLVQIPCIERNAFAAARAMDSNIFSTLSDGKHRISFDKVVDTMKKTGHDLPNLYKETSTGGLATEWKDKDYE